MTLQGKRIRNCHAPRYFLPHMCPKQARKHLLVGRVNEKLNNVVNGPMFNNTCAAQEHVQSNNLMRACTSSRALWLWMDEQGQRVDNKLLRQIGDLRVSSASYASPPPLHCPQHIRPLPNLPCRHLRGPLVIVILCKDQLDVALDVGINALVISWMLSVELRHTRRPQTQYPGTASSRLKQSAFPQTLWAAQSSLMRSTIPSQAI